jgi:hypothetical protein
VLTDAERSRQWVEEEAEVCVEYTCDKTHPHHVKQAPDALHYYHGRATKLVGGGVEVLFIGDPTAESTQVLSSEQMLRGIQAFKLCGCKDSHHMETSESSPDALQYDGIDFQFSADDDAWVKAGAQDFARSVIQSLDARMPEDPIMAALQIFDVSGMPSCDEEWRNVGHEYGNTQIETLIQHYGHNKRSERFKLIPGQEFLSKIDAGTVRAEWGLFKEVLFLEKKKNLSNEDTYKSLLQESSVLLEDAALTCIKYLSCVYLCLCLSTVWCERGFSLMNNIKIKSRNRMNTDTLDDRMMVCSNGPPVSAQHTTAINEIVDLAFEHWSQARTRIPSRSHPGVLRPRVGGGIEADVHDILSVADRAEEVNGHLRTMTQNAGAGQTTEGGEVGGDDDESEDDESHSADLHERMPAQQNLMDSVPPFVPPTSWIVMAHPASSDALKSFQWKGKRLAMKFEGGWSTASYKRVCTGREAPEGYHLFHYKDKGTKDIAHMLDLEDYGVTKKWVIITEISKEVENNAIARLNAYAKQYVPRRTGAAGGSSGGGGSSGRS